MTNKVQIHFRIKRIGKKCQNQKDMSECQIRNDQSNRKTCQN